MNRPLTTAWPSVPVEQFEAFLKECPDYTRTNYMGASVYRFRHNNESFAEAIVKDGIEEVVVNPKYLKA